MYISGYDSGIRCAMDATDILPTDIGSMYDKSLSVREEGVMFVVDSSVNGY